MMNPQTPTEKRDRTVRMLAIGLWVALAAIITAKTLHNPENHSTFPIFRDAARAWWNGVNVYDPNVFGADYRYGPSFALAMCPIAWLPYRAGALLWALLNVGIAYFATVALGRRILPGVEKPVTRDLVLIATVLPAAHCLYASQTNVLVFSLTALAAIAILDEHAWLAALLLSVAVHVKVWPLAAALLLAACWPRRLAWRLPIALVAVAALPLLVKPPAVVLESYVQWYRHLVGPAQIRHTYRDAWTIWELVSPPVNTRLYEIAQLGAAAVALGLCLRESRRLSPQRLALFILACWTTWQLVFGPGTERNTFGLIAPLTGWAVVVAVGQRWAAWLMGLAYLLTIASAIGGVEDLNPWLKTLHPVGVLLFFAWFSWWNFSASRPIWLPMPVTAAKAGHVRHFGGVSDGVDKSPHSREAPSCIAAES